MKKFIPLICILPLMAFEAPENIKSNENIKSKSVAWEITEGLTTEIGQRLAGTEAEARARDWTVMKLKSLGFKNVHIETYDMPVWVRGAETAEIIAPYSQKLVLTAIGNSGSTGDNGLVGDIVFFNTLDDLKAAPDNLVKGKIVFVTHQMKPTQDGSGYSAFGGARFSGPNIAAKKGATAYLLKSVGTGNHRVPHTGNTRFDKDVTAIPTAALSVPDAENLVRMITRSNTPVKIKLVLTPKQIGIRQSGNVVAEIPGSDPNAGIITIGGHLDSWDLGTGAIDDASGLGITTAAAKRIMDNSKPKRTIRVVWWGSEEVGGYGADAYYAAHKHENNVFVAESDFGADRVFAFSYNLPEKAKPIGERLTKELSKLGILYQNGKAHGGMDVGDFVEAGVAVVDLKQDGTRYFELHHNADDTLDKIDPAQLEQNVDAWEIMLRIIANAPEDLTPDKTAK